MSAPQLSALNQNAGKPSGMKLAEIRSILPLSQSPHAAAGSPS
jgi:hypothetical protein